MEIDNNTIRMRLIRHGETEDNVQRILAGQAPGKLTELGKVQAQATGKFLRQKSIKFDYIYVSDLRRTQQTFSEITKQAQYLTQLHKTDEPILRERSVGVLTGQPVSLWTENAKKEGKDIRDYKCEGAECWIDVMKRAQSFLKKIIEEHILHSSQIGKQISILGVTHGGVISEMQNIARIYNDQAPIHEGCNNCSISQFQIAYKGSKEQNFDHKNMEIKQLIKNYHAHLDEISH